MFDLWKRTGAKVFSFWLRRSTFGIFIPWSWYIGASILPNSCGICAGYGSERLGEDIVCISSTARNFQGRMGALSSGVYLSSPYTVAASAICGEISDPRNFIGIKNE